MTKSFNITDEVAVGGHAAPFLLMAGPCVLEDPKRDMAIGRRIKEISARLAIPYVFKASFDKANRTSVNGYRGPGLRRGLAMLSAIRSELGVPVVTDIHGPEQAAPVAETVDVIQIPALLSRQTDILLAAGRTGRVVNLKKGQFMAPADVEQAAAKIAGTGNQRIMLTERGTSFGYNNLVVDMRGLARMRKSGYPVVFDATHSVQLPGAAGASSGGEREYVASLVRAACGVGIDGLFLEVHDRPEEALCDGENMVPLDKLEELLHSAVAISHAAGGQGRFS